MSKVQPAYASFVPARLARLHGAGARVPQSPAVEHVEGTVACVDIVGYTALTESYAQHGPEGIEELNLLLRSFFSRLESLVATCGGDIMSFSGDSVMVLWTTEELGVTAASCAEAFVRDAPTTVAVEDTQSGTTLGIRVATVCGAFQLATVGGVGGHWHYVVVGTPLRELGARMHDPQPPVGSVLSKSPSTLNREAVPTAATSIDHGAGERLRCYMAPPVLEYFDARQQGWMSEYRVATTVFVGWDGVECLSDDGLATLHSAVIAIEQGVMRFGGTLLQIVVDDKGANALSVWGIAGRQHEDDPARAARAGLAIKSGLHRQGFSVSVGVSTGRVLCGLKGGDARCDFGPSGNSVNLAARLMAVQRGAVLCDAPTVHRAQRHLAFEPLGRLSLKGRALACDAFRAVDRPPADKDVLRDERGHSVLVGRASDRSRLVHWLEGAVSGTGGLVLLYGEPGIGKTSLLRELVQAAELLGIACLVGRADSVEAHTLYFPWRAVLQQLLSLESHADVSAWRRTVEVALASRPRLLGWRALLNDVVLLGFDETPVTRQMAEQARAEGAAEIVVRLLETSALRRPMLLVLDDAQWMDSMSWRLAAQLRKRLPGMLIAISMRGNQSLAAEELFHPELLAQADRFDLRPLSIDDTAALLCLRLGVNSVADAIVTLVYEKAAGNPFFSEEVAQAMQQSGHLVVQGDHCAIGKEGTNRVDLRIGDTLQSVIASRIDLLPAAYKTTLKVASVLGTAFSPDMLAGLLPENGTGTDLAAQLAAFTRLELVVGNANVASTQFSFKHGVTREVAYAMLTAADRRQLHEGVASWLERAHAQDLGPFYPLLAHHWEQAGHQDATLRYLFKAGEQAIERFANREGSEFLGRALAMLQHSSLPSERALQASCEQLLGNALLWMGRLSESREHLQNSLALRGFAVPHTRMGKVLGSIVLLTGYLVRRMLRMSSARDALTPQERDAAMAMLRLGHIGYFQEDTLLMVFSSVRCVDFAGRAEECRESALMLAALASAAGSVPMHRTAVAFGEQALKVAGVFGDASVHSQALLFSAIYRAGIGDWPSGFKRIARAIALSEQSGDNRRREECLVLEGYLHFHAGKCSDSLRSFDQVARAARLRGDLQTAAWGLLGVSRVLIRMDRWDEALKVLGAARNLISDRVSMIELQGQLALVHLHRAERGLSLVAARAGLQFAVGARPTSFTTLTGLRGIAETLIELWCSARAGTDSNEDVRSLGRDTQAALRAMERYARIFPIATPRLLLLRGRQQFGLGRPARCLRLWRKSLAEAKRLHMPDEQTHAASALASIASGEEALAAQAHADAVLAQAAMDSTTSLNMTLPFLHAAGTYKEQATLAVPPRGQP